MLLHWADLIWGINMSVAVFSMNPSLNSEIDFFESLQKCHTDCHNVSFRVPKETSRTLMMDVNMYIVLYGKLTCFRNMPL